MVEVAKVETGKTPIFYANGVQFRAQVYDFQLDFTLQSDQDAAPVIVASVHMSPHLAKTVGRLLRRNVKAYEQQAGAEIDLPQALLDELKIADLVE